MQNRDRRVWSAAGGRGARVLKTGIALVHEGELVLPAAGSEAQAAMVLADERAVVNFYFPVEIEVRGAARAADTRQIDERTLRRASRAVENL